MRIRADVRFRVYSPRFWPVGQSQVESLVDLGFVGRVGVADHGCESGEPFDDRLDLLLAHAGWRGRRAERGFGLEAVGLGVVDPGCDFVDVSPGVDRGPVAGHLGFAVADRCSRLGDGVQVGAGAVLRGGHGLDGVLDPVRRELAGEPVVQRGQQVALFDEHVERVGDLVCQRVLGREAAPVVGHLVGPVALHLAVAYAADDPAAEHVDVAGAEPLARPSQVPATLDELLRLLEGLGVDDRRVHDLL